VGARIISQLFRASPAHSAAPIATALVLAAAGTMAVAGSLQVIYERVFGQQHRGWRDILRFLTWAGVPSGVLVTESTIHSGQTAIMNGLPSCHSSQTCQPRLRLVTFSTPQHVQRYLPSSGTGMSGRRRLQAEQAGEEPHGHPRRWRRAYPGLLLQAPDRLPDVPVVHPFDPVDDPGLLPVLVQLGDPYLAALTGDPDLS
jgi:hypothetical protein